VGGKLLNWTEKWCQAPRDDRKVVEQTFKTDKQKKVIWLSKHTLVASN
jgi:hypothetical protein